MPDKPVFVAELANLVQERIRDANQVVFGFNQNHHKWLLMFTYQWFSTRTVDIKIDLQTKPPRIYITPFRDENRTRFGVGEWLTLIAKLKLGRHDRDLPKFLGIPEFKIKFLRGP